MKGENFKTAFYAFGLLLLTILIGVMGYIIIEGFNFTEAFYMTVITMATVGFKEVQPLSDIGRLFTSFLIIFSFGIFVYAVTTFTRYVIDGVFKNYYKDNKVKRKIQKLQNHVIICGYGRNGKQATIELMEHDVPIIIIEKDEAIIEKMREDGEILYIEGDATRDEILHSAKIESAMALITTFPVDADNLFVVLTAREINPNLKIISRASDDNSDIKLKRAGATNVIMPDKVGGQRMAKLVVQPDIVEFLEYIMLQKTKDVKLEEISCQNLASCFSENTIGELGIRNISGANIIGLKSEKDTYIFNPSPKTIISSKDQLFVLGNPQQLAKLRDILINGK